MGCKEDRSRIKMSEWAIYATLALISATIAPTLLIFAIKKIYNQQFPTLEWLLLSVDFFLFAYWLIITFASIPV
jgi:hypothetical protein